jgi:hypothetical protein
LLTKTRLGFILACLWSLPAVAEQVSLPPINPDSCRDIIGFEQRLAQFLDDVRMITTDPGDGRVAFTASASAFAAFEAQANSVTGDARNRLCAEFERVPMLTAAASVARQQLRQTTPPDSVTAAQCQSTDAYLGVFAAQQVLMGFAAIAESVSDASSCPAYAGVVACGPVAPTCAFNGPLAALATSLAQSASVPLTLDDNCRENRRNDVIDDFVADNAMRHARINQDLKQTLLPRIDLQVSKLATAQSLAQFDDQLRVGFGDLDDRLDNLEFAVTTAGASSSKADELAERLSVEITLLRGGVGVASLQLPASAGGQLERVREIVSAGILALQTLGQDMSPALSRFQAGDTALNKGDFRTAFTAYQDAYRLAASLSGGRR